MTEVRLNDRKRKSAGNIDVVLVSYDDATGNLIDFGALEVQSVYISGNVRNVFREYSAEPHQYLDVGWLGKNPRADYLSSSRKRLAPQLIYKGGILHSLDKKMAVAVDEGFFSSLPNLPEVAREEADVAWLVYDLIDRGSEVQYLLTRTRTVYTKFTDALRRITDPDPGPIDIFVESLQRKLKRKLAGQAVRSDPTPIEDIFSE